MHFLKASTSTSKTINLRPAVFQPTIKLMDGV